MFKTSSSIYFPLHFSSNIISSFLRLRDDFVRVNPRELISVDSSIQSESDWTFLCHRDPRCRTFVFDTSTCRLYEGSISTGQIVLLSSNNSVVGDIDYDYINLSSACNQSCIPQFVQGHRYNTSDQCRNDLQLVCSRVNKTCLSMSETAIENSISLHVLWYMCFLNNV